MLGILTKSIKNLSSLQSRKATQLGAMSHSTPPTDLDAVRSYRLGRVVEQLKQRDLAGIILSDQLNIRYTTDSTNMQIWCSHFQVRQALVFPDGSCYLFDYADLPHLAAGLPLITKYEVNFLYPYLHSGSRQEEYLGKWKNRALDLIKKHSGENKRLAIDQLHPKLSVQLYKQGYDIQDGFQVMEHARSIKSQGEIALMRKSIESAQEGIRSMRDFLKPGITENELWAKLQERNSALGGEWCETRLLSSGYRTNPWFAECSHKIIQKGELVSFDTDLVGPYGYCADISRSWVCDSKPTDHQRRLYEQAYKQIDYNMNLLKPGVSFKQISERVRESPEHLAGQRYGVAMHGIGLCDEWPCIVYKSDYENFGYDGVIMPGMLLCVEALVGINGYGEAVKLEELVEITETGAKKLSNYQLEEDYL